MKKIIYSLLFAHALVVLGACSQSSASTDVPRYTVIKEGAYDLLPRDIKFIEQQSELDTLFSRFASDAGPAPVVNFNEKIVLYVSAGVQGSGGYALSLESLEHGSDDQGMNRALIAHVRHHLTRRGCPVTGALTSPYFVATIDREAIANAVLVVQEEVTLGPRC